MTSTQEGRPSGVTACQLDKVTEVGSDRGVRCGSWFGRGTKLGGFIPVVEAKGNAVAALRQKLEPTPGKPQFILTVHGQGYKFVG